MRRANRHLSDVIVAILLIVFSALPAWAVAKKACEKPVYLTLDTGHMGVADLIADVLNRQQVRVTFFAANERTQTGDSTLGEQWAPWWKARATEGHELASHSFDHVYWRADLAGTPPTFRVQPSAGPESGKTLTFSVAQ